MNIYSVVVHILEILSLAMPAAFYGYKLWKEIRMDKAKKSEPSVSVRAAHLDGTDIDISIR